MTIPSHAATWLVLFDRVDMHTETYWGGDIKRANKIVNTRTEHTDCACEVFFAKISGVHDDKMNTIQIGISSVVKQ